MAAESFFQHAEHYQRIHAAFNAERKVRDSERSAEDSSSDEGSKDTQSAESSGDETAVEEKTVVGEPVTTAEASGTDSDQVKPKPRRRRSSSSRSCSRLARNKG